MIPSYNADIFQRIYHDVLEIKQELKKSTPEEQYHDWIDFEDNHYIPCILQDREWVYITEKKIKEDK